MAENIGRHALAGVVLAVSFFSSPSQAQTGADVANDLSGGAAGVRAAVPDCLTGDSLLDTPVMRELLRLLWDHSNPDGPPSERRERGGFLFDSSGVLLYRADLDNPHDTPCRSGAIVPLGGRPVAGAFTHPFWPGDLLPANCHPEDPTPRRYTADRLGGASEEDLSAQSDWEVPSYIMDHEWIYAVPRGATKDNAASVTKRYPRIDLESGCNII